MPITNNLPESLTSRYDVKNKIAYLRAACSAFFNMIRPFNKEDYSSNAKTIELYKVFILQELMELYRLKKYYKFYVEVSNDDGMGENLKVNKIYNEYNQMFELDIIETTQECINVFNSPRKEEYKIKGSINFVSVLYFYRLTSDKIKGTNAERISVVNLGDSTETKEFITGLSREIGLKPEELESVAIEVERSNLSKNVPPAKEDGKNLDDLDNRAHQLKI